MIQLKKVTKQYGDNFGLSDVNIKINDGEFVFLVGPSGAGKSTFIKLILKEIEPDEGSIYFDDMEVTSMSNGLCADVQEKYRHSVPGFPASSEEDRI